MIKPLTSLRFFFALMVFLSHMWLLQDVSPYYRDIYDNILYEGYIGVSFFFILSGFILSYNYHDKLLNGEVRIRQFGLARIARIYPLHILTLLLAIPLSFSSDFIEWFWKLFLNLFLLQSFVPSNDVYFYFNSVSWSISDEFFFYLLFPFLILLLHIRRNFRIVPLIILLVPVLIFFAREDYHEKLFYINPLFRVIDFMIGILLFRVFRKRSEIELLKNKQIATAAELLSIVFLGIFVYFHNDVPQGFRYSCYYWPPMIFLIYTFSYANGAISGFLSNKRLVYLGEISFGFYMLHMLVLRYYEYLPQKFHVLYAIMPKNYMELFIVFTATLLLSMISFKWFEQPMNRLIKRKVGPKMG